MSYHDQPDEHPGFMDNESGPVWEPAMGNVRGPLHRPAMKKDRIGEVHAIPIPEMQEAFVTSALPYLKTEDAGFILAHPNSANSRVFAAQRNGDMPQALPTISLLQAVLGMRADFDRRIRQHAIPTREGQLGRERFEELEALAAPLVGRLEAAHDEIEYLRIVVGELVRLLGLRDPVRAILAARQITDPWACDGHPLL
jgi:hypothetical protein